jgi:hypothetical protein
MCTWIVPCIITEFKIEIRGRRIKAKFNINGNVVPIEAINTFKKLEFDDIVIFYDIIGITRQYKTKVQFKPSQLIIKPCDR